MAPDTEIPVAAKDRLASGVAQRARAPWLRFGRLPLVLVACALLAAGGYYAWRTWYGQGKAAVGFITAVAERGNLTERRGGAVRWWQPLFFSS
jgi:hypothetical protein